MSEAATEPALNHIPTLEELGFDPGLLRERYAAENSLKRSSETTSVCDRNQRPNENDEVRHRDSEYDFRACCYKLCMTEENVSGIRRSVNRLPCDRAVNNYMPSHWHLPPLCLSPKRM